MKYFTTKTFTYFENAKKNKNNEKWFIKNKNLYLEHVREPFSHLITLLHDDLAINLPRIRVEPKLITRPLRSKNRNDKDGLIKSVSYVTFWEKKTSLFEWNPGLHIQFGASKEDNFLGIGLYMVSSRQLSRLRGGITDDYEDLHSLLQDRKLKKTWGSLLGEKYKRFPKNFDINTPSAHYLWHKQFYLGKTLLRRDVTSKNFAKNVVKDFRLAIPFFQWIRQTVGTYSR